MSNQRERRLDSLLNEVGELRERMEQILPSYTASLQELAQLPDEFEQRFWASCVEALLHEVKARYQDLEAQAQRADLVGKFMTLGMYVIARTGGMEPVPPPEPVRLGISISPSGKMEPDWLDNPNRDPKAIFMTYEEFVTIAKRLEDKLLRGTIVPSSEDEIPRLIHSEASA